MLRGYRKSPGTRPQVGVPVRRRAGQYCTPLLCARHRPSREAWEAPLGKPKAARQRRARHGPRFLEFPHSWGRPMACGGLAAARPAGE